MSELAVETLGRPWFGEQLEVAETSSGPVHPIISWYRDAMEWQQRNADENNQVSARLSGPAKAWFLLAYDVWVLAHHFLLKPLLERLRDLKQFQGARYELTTYALFVRGEFTLERDEETDASGKHVEFFARHRKTGEQVAVEAKCRHRPGVLGYPRAGYTADSDPEPRITGLLRAALAQRRPMPYVICIELTLPPAADEREARKKLDGAHEEVELVSREYTQNGEAFPATLVVVTNYAHHYGPPDEPDPGGYQTVIGVRSPAHPFTHPDTERQIIDALSAYGNLPRSWEDFER